MFKLQVKSPTRVDLSGGTLDCWPLYLFLENPVTVNVAIDIFTYVDLEELPGKEIVFDSKDLSITKTYSGLEECLADTAPEFDLVRAHVKWWRPAKGFRVSTKSESPIGGGLGGSSSLCISLLKAFSAWLKQPLAPNDMVRIASHLEAQVLLKPTGTQDYFPPIFGGLNVITYGVPGPSVEVKPIDQELFRDRFLLVYTGRSHHSGINNWQVIKNWLDGDTKTRESLARLAAISEKMKNAVIAGQLNDLPPLFTQEYEARTQLSEGFSSPEIRRLSEIAKSKGAIAKICGAGGGGCVLIWCPDRQIAAVKAALANESFQVMNAQPWQEDKPISKAPEPRRLAQ